PESELAWLLRAARVPTPRAVGRAAAAGLDTVLHLVKDRFAAGEAALAEGALHAVSAACTHMGCIVHWNEAEQTWDCPCHGGRYSRGGQVFSGPPLADLKPRPLPHELAAAS